MSRMKTEEMKACLSNIQDSHAPPLQQFSSRFRKYLVSLYNASPLPDNNLSHKLNGQLSQNAMSYHE